MSLDGFVDRGSVLLAATHSLCTLKATRYPPNLTGKCFTINGQFLWLKCCWLTELHFNEKQVLTTSWNIYWGGEVLLKQVNLDILKTFTFQPTLIQLCLWMHIHILTTNLLVLVNCKIGKLDLITNNRWILSKVYKLKTVYSAVSTFLKHPIVVRGYCAIIFVPTCHKSNAS